MYAVECEMFILGYRGYAEGDDYLFQTGESWLKYGTGVCKLY